MHVAVMLPNWIGDVVMATPTLRALRKHFGGDAQITGVMRPYVADVLAGTSWLSQTLTYDPKSEDRRQHTWPVARQLRRTPVDCVILLPNSLRAGVFAWLSGARRRVGYARYGRGMFLNQKLKPPRSGRRLMPVSAVDYYLQLAYSVGCFSEPRRLELATTGVCRKHVDEIWQRFQFDARQRVVVINTGGAYGSAKNWPIEHFAQLARRVATQLHTGVLVVCGPAERTAAQEIEQQAACPLVRSLAKEPLGIGLTKACIARSQLVVSTDSGPRHLAAAFGVPTIALFGPTDPGWSINYHPQETHLRQDLACSPCGRRVCPLGHHRCMTDLSVSEVFRAVQQVVERTGQEAA